MSTKKQILLGFILLVIVTLLQFFQNRVPVSERIHHGSAESFDQDIASAAFVLVDFYTDWCGPCKAQQPALNKLADRELDGFVICKINGDEAPQLVSTNYVTGYPTLILFHEGKEVDRKIGRVRYEELEAWVRTARTEGSS